MMMHLKSLKQATIKYVVCAGDNLILTLKGFKDANHLNDSQVKLFPSPAHAKAFIEQSKYCNCEGLFIKKVIFIMEVFDDEIMAL